MKLGTAMTAAVKMPINAYIVEAKLICVFVTPFSSMFLLKNASDATPPAGKNILIKLRFRNRIIVEARVTLAFTAEKEA